MPWATRLRPIAATLLGNLAGYAAWRFALAAIPGLWAGQTPESNIAWLLALTALTFILLATPPVLVGALAAWLARRSPVAVGLLSGLWSLSLLQPVPAELPLAPGLWYASTVLVLCSGAAGGWTMAGLALRVQPTPSS
jgi:hypothetical protein